MSESMPRSSITIWPWVLARLVVVLCSASERIAATLAWERPSLRFAFRQRMEPWVLRDSARLAPRSSASAPCRALELGTLTATVPSGRMTVRRQSPMPTSTPTVSARAPRLPGGADLQPQRYRPPPLSHSFGLASTAHGPAGSRERLGQPGHGLRPDRQFGHSHRQSRRVLDADVL